MTHHFPLLILLLALTSGCGNPVEEIRPTGAAAVTGTPFTLTDRDWPGWRGAFRNGIAEQQHVPTQWSDTENVVWKSEIPGRGHASPTIVGERIFLATADEKAQTQSILALSRADGQQLWITQLHSGGFPGDSRFHVKSSHASGTLACDGSAVYGAFLNHEKIYVSAVDVDGNILWQKEIGPFDSKFGYAPSPTLYEGLVLVAADNQGGGYLAALKRADGEIVWRIQRPAVSTYATPVVAHVAGRDQLLLSGARTVKAYDPHTGDELWSVDGTAEATVGTMVWDANHVFASGGYPQSETLCVDASNGAVVWRSREKLYVPSLLVHDGFLYGVDDKGIARCWDASTGKMQWEGRLSSDNSSSPVLAGDNIFVCDERGTAWVFKAVPSGLEVVGKNPLGDQFFASPVIVENRLYLRAAHGSGSARREVLYCIGSPSESL